jgi:hypothetical protein
MPLGHNRHDDDDNGGRGDSCANLSIQVNHLKKVVTMSSKPLLAACFMLVSCLAYS